MIEQIFLSVLVFTGVVLILVSILNFAESKLLPQGEITINVNGEDDKNIITKPGGTLLSALAGQSSFYLQRVVVVVCAMCECQVIEGGGDILPTETGHINRTKAKDHWRLACQVKIKEDMKIKVPDEIFSIQKWEATVESNNNVATFIKRTRTKSSPG